MGKYDHLLDCERPVDRKHPPMPLANRAAQFAPFDALTGFSGQIHETARITDSRIDLSEEALQTLDEQLQILCEHLAEHPELTLTYFVPDATKKGGSYQTLTSTIQNIKLYEREIILEDQRHIAFKDILELESPLFS